MSFDSLAKSFLGFLFSRSMLNATVVVLGAIVVAYGCRMFLNAVGFKIKKTFLAYRHLLDWIPALGGARHIHFSDGNCCSDRHPVWHCLAIHQAFHQRPTE